MSTKISWASETWNVSIGCSQASDECQSCYAIGVAHRAMQPAHAGLTVMTDHGVDWTGEVRLLPERLKIPFGWRKPRRVFLDSMSDIFHPNVPDSFIADVFAVMAIADQHQYQVLTKRPQRMARLLNSESFPSQVARAADRISVECEVEKMGVETLKPIDGFPDYLVTDRGRVLLKGGSDICLWCGGALEAGRIARSRFCSQQCNSKAHYEESVGRWSEPESFRAMNPDVMKKGHLRVQLVAPDGARRRMSVHRLVLTAFGGPSPEDDAQVCHRDGDPSNNALPNLRWGTQADNWTDRIRHGRGRSHSVLTIEQVRLIREMHGAGSTAVDVGRQFGISDTQVRNIVRGDQWAAPSGWPLPAVWAGASIGRDKFSFRADHVRATPAAVRWLSLEPLLEDLPSLDLTGISWVVVGGESGPKARPMRAEWAADLRDRCADAGVAYFFKQAGAVLAREWGMKGAGHVVEEMPEEFRVQQYPDER